MESENKSSMIGDDNDEWTTISIAQQQQQQSSTIQPCFTRSTCSHTILNSPSSSCRLHVVNLNRSSSTINNHRSSLGDHTNSKSSEWFLSRQSSMPTATSHHGNGYKNPQKSSVSTPTNVTELSSISSPQSPPSTICPPPARFANTPRKSNSLRSHHHSRYFQSPTLLSKSSSTRTSLSNTINFVPPPPQFTSTDWLKFGFKILLLFTVLFWLFSIVTWMSIMPKTMPISLTIITSMMTIGLIISLVIQSEWPYSFEFIPNVEDFTGIDDSSDDSDANDHDNLMTNKAKNHRNNNNDDVNRMAPHRKPNHNKTGYKNISNPSNQDKNLNKNKKQNPVTCREESTDSGLGNSNANGNEITVIQIDHD